MMAEATRRATAAVSAASFPVGSCAGRGRCGKPGNAVLHGSAFHAGDSRFCLCPLLTCAPTRTDRERRLRAQPRLLVPVLVVPGLAVVVSAVAAPGAARLGAPVSAIPEVLSTGGAGAVGTPGLGEFAAGSMGVAAAAGAEAGPATAADIPPSGIGTAAGAAAWPVVPLVSGDDDSLCRSRGGVRVCRRPSTADEAA